MLVTRRLDPQPSVGESVMDMRQCKTCGIDKPIEEFPINEVKGKKYRRWDCDECWARKRKKHNEDNKERNRAVAKIYYDAHREEICAKASKWNADNRERRAATKKVHDQSPAGRAEQKRGREKRHDKISAYHTEYMREWRSSPEEQKKQTCRIEYHKARRRGDVQELDGPCETCSEPWEQVHHWRSYDPEDCLTVQWLCIYCHIKADAFMKAQIAAGVPREQMVKYAAEGGSNGT